MSAPSDTPGAPSPPPELFYAEHNASAPGTAETVIFLHGAFGSHREWDHVLKHLDSASGSSGSKQFHILVPDLPQHSQSRATAPHFTLPGAADAVAHLIRQHARSGRAHVVGLSLGGFIGQLLVRRHPDVVSSLFVTGATPFTWFQNWAARRARVVVHWSLWALVGGRIYKAICAKSGLVEHELLVKDIMENNGTGDLAEAVYGDLADWTWEMDVEEVARAAATAKGTGDGLRVLVCAGGQGDDVEGTKRLAEAVRKGRQGNRGGDAVVCEGFVVRNAIHGWSLQFPELFARGVTAWIGDGNMPEEFEALL
ncbi:Alpha/Beta hydrolase protein [Microdochium bolleyi]|uniref:Alpha/Beta hydrolase protein n=1 Tax=Microdochium bolleyi TaxID=196109 RepID=A0A136JGG8_9PEZI|nr:Alpha/Beta hydrolase protein [Microdochium bolleyi]